MTTTAEQWERVQHALGTAAWTPEVGAAITDAVSLRSRMEQLERINVKLQEELDEAVHLPLPETHVLLAKDNMKLRAQVEQLEQVVEAARAIDWHSSPTCYITGPCNCGFDLLKEALTALD